MDNLHASLFKKVVIVTLFLFVFISFFNTMLADETALPDSLIAPTQTVTPSSSPYMYVDYYISVHTTEGGSILPIGNSFAYPGSTISYQIVPQSGYRIEDVKIDGASMGVITNYNFTDIQRSHDISASFVLISLATPTVPELSAILLLPMSALIILSIVVAKKRASKEIS
jgi:hypothetical protein